MTGIGKRNQDATDNIEYLGNYAIGGVGILLGEEAPNFIKILECFWV
jgi:hypothetical protein